MHVYFLMLLCFLSCNQEKVNPFYKLTEARWIATTSIEKINPNYKSLELITKPQRTIQPILKINFLDINFQEVSDCLFYKVSALTDGEVFVVANPKMLDCKNLIAESPYAKILNIRNFGLNISENLVLKVDKEKFNYKLLNLKRTRTLSLLSPSEEQSFLVNSNYYYPQNSTTLKDGETCFEVQDDCSSSKDECSKCEGGFFLVITNKCPTKFSKVCGINSCGNKNDYACIRGLKTSELSIDSYCINDSPYGFCKDDLRVRCENGILICE